MTAPLHHGGRANCSVCGAPMIMWGGRTTAPTCSTECAVKAAQAASVAGDVAAMFQDEPYDPYADDDALDDDCDCGACRPRLGERT